MVQQHLWRHRCYNTSGLAQLDIANLIGQQQPSIDDDNLGSSHRAGVSTDILQHDIGLKPHKEKCGATGPCISSHLGGSSYHPQRAAVIVSRQTTSEVFGTLLFDKNRGSAPPPPPKKKEKYGEIKILVLTIGPS